MLEMTAREKGGMGRLQMCYSISVTMSWAVKGRMPVAAHSLGRNMARVAPCVSMQGPFAGEERKSK